MIGRKRASARACLADLLTNRERVSSVVNQSFDDYRNDVMTVIVSRFRARSTPVYGTSVSATTSTVRPLERCDSSPSKTYNVVGFPRAKIAQVSRKFIV